MGCVDQWTNKLRKKHKRVSLRSNKPNYYPGHSLPTAPPDAPGSNRDLLVNSSTISQVVPMMGESQRSDISSSKEQEQANTKRKSVPNRRSTSRSLESRPIAEDSIREHQPLATSKDLRIQPVDALANPEISERRLLECQDKYRLLNEEYENLRKKHEKLHKNFNGVSVELTTLQDKQDKHFRLEKSYSEACKDLSDERAKLHRAKVLYDQSEDSRRQNLFDKNAADSQIADLQEEIDKYKVNLRAETVKSTKLEEKIVLLEQSKQSIAQELSSFLTDAGTFADDRSFIKLWISLKGKVSDWAHNHFHGSIIQEYRGNSVFGAEETSFHGLCRDPTVYLNKGSRRPSLVQSLVWSVLMDAVFAPPNDDGLKIKGTHWAYPERMAVYCLRLYLRPRESRRLSIDCVIRIADMISD
jgi:hypothetical protein